MVQTYVNEVIGYTTVYGILLSKNIFVHAPNTYNTPPAYNSGVFSISKMEIPSILEVPFFKKKAPMLPEKVMTKIKTINKNIFI